MQIIKNQQLSDNTWRYIADEDELAAGDIVVSLTKWRQTEDQLLNRNGKIGVRIGPADSIENLTDKLANVQLIELDFPEFADGRLFSLAWLLRSRYHYQGEIRAVGHYMPDQVFYLSRVGVNAFAAEQAEQVPMILAHLADFSVRYQDSIN